MEVMSKIPNSDIDAGIAQVKRIQEHLAAVMEEARHLPDDLLSIGKTVPLPEPLLPVSRIFIDSPIMLQAFTKETETKIHRLQSALVRLCEEAQLTTLPSCELVVLELEKYREESTDET
jgi:hypothetical protein